MEIKDVKVGQTVRIVDTVPSKINTSTFSVYGSERVGVVVEVDPRDTQLPVLIRLLNGSVTWGKVTDIELVSEVIHVDCYKPNILKRIWNYLRGVK